MSDKQPEALRLSDVLASPHDWYEFDPSAWCPQAAAELRRLHAKNELLIELLHKAFPFVEDAASDEVYKSHRVHKILDDIRGAIAVHDAIRGKK